MAGMAFFDFSLDQLKTYCPDREEPADFDAFWQQTLADARLSPLNATFEAVDYGLAAFETFDVTFNGYGGQPIKGWLQLPRQRSGRLPCVVEYIGYGGGRGFPTDWLLWSSAGFAHLVMDTRGQGSAWSAGHTPDPDPVGAPAYPGFLTRGLRSPEEHYYRRVYTDGVRAVEAVRAHPAVDAARVAVVGASQGGGITIAVAGLADGLAAALPDVPFLCDFRRATSMVDSHPYAEVRQYLHTHRDAVDQAFRTLDHLDGVHLAATATAASLWSVALMDDICPPSTVYAAYNAWAGPKQIVQYPYNGHEGGGPFHEREKLAFLRSVLG